MENKPGGRRGPKGVPRKACLINMLETDYRDLTRWAEEGSSTKAEVFREMMARERERREGRDHG
ncbi:hypothetical protein [Caniella muris]|uniref:hypothetical protein n=1 Tax=Caniella muris TaxID=2941502 RepID=UPI00204020E0|nr:hypothetical protein [Caniella muris]